MQDNAFFNRALTLPAKQEGTLSGLNFSVKDVFAVEGHRNSAGNPTWLATHEAETNTAPVIEWLLEQGASLKGMTHTDELMYSLNGENIHYGTPLNPIAPNCIPGGSSSGSASAVANGLSDFALGTDTGGSVRVPSSYCGLYGIRPTHGDVSIEGVIPLAPSFDTVGWMAKDSETLAKVGNILLPEATLKNFEYFYIEKTAWGLLEQEDRDLLQQVIPSVVPKESVDLTPFGYSEWPETFKLIQGIEAWKAHGEWIKKEKPTFAPAIQGRFDFASKIPPSQYEGLKERQSEISEILQQLLGEHWLFVIPTAASVAFEKNLSGEAVEQLRTITMQLTCIAGLGGLPQVTVPVFQNNGMALGLSFIANKHSDRSLLAFVHQHFGGKS